MLRLVLIGILIILVARAFWRLVDGVIDGVSGRERKVPQQRGVHMVRDPECGTFILPERAITVTDGRQQIHFCSTTCRDKYRSRTA